MSKEEAIEQLYRLSIDWKENGLDTKLNQTDINAIGMVISELDIANKKLDKIKELVNKYGYYTLSEIPELLSIIGSE